MEDIYESDSVKSSQSIAVNLSASPELQSPPSLNHNRFVSLFGGNVKRCSQCLTAVVHFIIACSICHKLSCCKCIEQVKKCCNVYLLNKMNRIIRTPHYPLFLNHVCSLNQTSPPEKRHYDDMTDNFICHERLVRAKFSLNLLTVEKIDNESLVLILLQDLMANIELLESLFVHLLFNGWIPTSMLTSNLALLNGRTLPKMPDSRYIDIRFKILYQHVLSTQKDIKKHKLLKVFLSNCLKIVYLSVIIVTLWHV